MKETIKLTINQEEYDMIKEYKDNNQYRQSLNRLTKKTYGFDFEEWYQQGYWGDKYRPYSLLHNGEVVANVSASTIDFLIEGELHRTVQIGTVMTEEAYRNKGLSKELMNIVIKEYENTCDVIYLYANDSVLDFYPKFGFAEAQEYVYRALFTEKENKLSCRKLNLKEAEDRALITRLVSNTNPISKISMIANPGLIMFYLYFFMSEDLYYIEELDLAAVVDFDGDKMYLMDLFCEHDFDLEQAINALTNQSEMKVTLGFTPAREASFTIELFKEEGTTFFIRGASLLEKGKFPILSHA